MLANIGQIESLWWGRCRNPTKGSKTWQGTHLSWTTEALRDASWLPELGFALPATHLFQKQVVLLFLEKINVPGGDDAHQAAPHAARVSDGDTTEAMPGLGFKHIPYAILGAEDHRVRNESLLVFLEGMVRKGISEPLPSSSWSEAWALCQLPLWQ